ncbi:uncharacterized protein TRIREDRAFT_120485 [Trichoderma reesei QM6a]|uniref:Predicted protein n=2 Tax=Hypocrea jecorina TaxID=51453 RepID=G0RCM4_HYPJQ|nr:uncharacterized protein TRIREDRAFT_120485 [Trichoderma reesei QM6a]EGR51531.1 predicted protein [Trichoderma reesei QM6a]ETS04388.1 hypothetical protein M419DRAFT_33216 [Trichoderma reesei RUT C-30]
MPKRVLGYDHCGLPHRNYSFSRQPAIEHRIFVKLHDPRISSSSSSSSQPPPSGGDSSLTPRASQLQWLVGNPHFYPADSAVRLTAMSVRSAAQCPPRGIVSPSSAVWITDAVLRHAIDRYHRQFPAAAPCRRISSHSGPLESRRRQLGKRNMTGIMPSSATYPPLWHFDVAWIPSECKWEPPSTAEERRKKKQSLSPSALFESLISWLEKSDADKPFIQPPPADDIVCSASTGEATVAAPAEAAVPEYVYHDPPIPAKVPRVLSALRRNISLLDTVDEKALERLLRPFQRRFFRRMETADLTVEALRVLMEPLDQAARDRISDPEMADLLIARVRRSLLTGLEIAQNKVPDSVILPDLWTTFVSIVCSSGSGYQNIRLFRKALELMPADIRARIPMDDIKTLARSSLVAQASKCNLLPDWIRVASQSGEALSNLSPLQLQDLDLEINALILKRERDSEENRRLRFAWLMAKAYNSAATNEEIVQSYRELIASHGIDLASAQLWQVIAARLKSAEAITTVAHYELTRYRYTSLSGRWAALFSAIHSLPSANNILTELYGFFKDIDRTDILIDAVHSLPVSRMSIDTARTIATACDDHRLALQLYETIRARLGQGSRVASWGWEAWVPYLERIIKDPEITRPVHWELLDLPRLTTPPDADPEEIAREIQAKMALVDSIGQWYMEAPHLNERQLLRRLHRCVSVQRALARAVSPQVLARVAEVVTRDLQGGDWGRTTRLRWLLSIIAQTHGEKQAGDVSKTLEGWRRMLDRKAC